MVMDHVLRVALKIFVADILELVQDSCPSDIPDVGKMLGKGLHGEAYEIDGNVLKIGIAKDEDEAQKIVDNILSLKSKNNGAFVDVIDAAVLCPIKSEDSRWVLKEGVAFYYIMEKLTPISKDVTKYAARIYWDIIEADKKGQPLKGPVNSWKKRFKSEGDDPKLVDDIMSLYERVKSSGFSHNDIKSDNIGYSESGELKLMDLDSIK